MTNLREWLIRLWGSIRGHQRDLELEEELRIHLELAAEDERRRGGAPGDAERAVALRQGGLTPAMDALRDQRGLPWLDELIADVRYAVRVIARAPSFAVAVVGVLALGIGANTAIFSIVNAVLLRPMPFEEPDRLVRLFTKPPPTAFPGQSIFAVSPGKFYDWQRSTQSFDGMALYRFRQFALTGTGTARAIEAAAVGDGFFEVIRVRPTLGRVFRPDEDVPGGDRVVVLSDRFWKSELGGTPNVIGGTLRLNDEVYAIVGVMPPTAYVASWNAMTPDIWVPMALTEQGRAVRDNHTQRAVARLKRNVSLDQAQSEMDGLSTRLGDEFPASDGGWGAVVVPMREEIVGNSRTMLIMLLGAVALVLLIACANVGNLLFTRALARRKEIAIRSALGAGPGRVFRQLLTEALVLAGAGGAVGLLLAQMGVSFASRLPADQMPRADEISIDARVMLFAFGVSILTGVLAGTIPALRARRSDLNDALKDGGRSGGAVGIGTRRLLVVCEVALSLVLLMGAGVMIQSLVALRYSENGFDANYLLTMRVALAGTRYPQPAQRASFFDAAVERLRALPGVEAVGTIDSVPLVDGSTQPLALDGAPESLSQNQVVVQVRRITPGYFRSMRIPVLRGRDAVESDVDVLVVSRAAAELLWGADDPIGHRARLPLLSKTVAHQVIGIVGDVKQRSLADEPAATVYYYTRERSWGDATFVIRTLVPPATLAQSAVAAIHAVDRDQPVQDVQTMIQVLDGRLTSLRFVTLLLGLFAGLAVVLASMGIFSVLSYIVRGRRREIGIRTALGAQTSDVLRLVLLEGMFPTLIGIGAGGIAALASARILEGLVFGVSASDPLTLAGVAGMLAMAALIASIGPAYSAARLSPLEVLRAE
jgi:putative ABC transport system permease protein